MPEIAKELEIKVYEATGAVPNTGGPIPVPDPLAANAKTLPPGTGVIYIPADSKNTRVEPAGVQAVYSIRVDSDDHAFRANGFVHHNTEARLDTLAMQLIGEIGENTVIAAQTGISGSAKIGKRNQIAGQVGMVGHIETADDVIIIAQSGVSKSITRG